MSEVGIQRLVFYSFGFSGLAALLYEVVWFRALSLVMGSTTYALSTMLATFMAGLSIGSYMGGVVVDKVKKPILLYAYLEGVIAIIALLVLSMINIIPPLYAKLYYAFRFSFAAFSVSQFFFCSLVIIVPTILMGATFPAVCRICYTGNEIGKEMGKIYAINTIGAIAGSMIAGFVLIPGLGLKAANTIGASINFLIAIMCFLAARPLTSVRVRGGAWMLLVFFIFSLFFVFRASNGEAYSFNFYAASRYRSYENFWLDFAFAERLYDRDNAAGNIRVVKNISGDMVMINNGKIESDNVMDLPNLAALAFLPVAAKPDARSFLNIGLGTGGTVSYAASVSTLEEIISVEINPSVMEAVKLFFYPEIFSDKRIKFIAADARNYLTLVERKYDIISSEPSYPVDQGFSHLYSVEFFGIVKNRLNEGGVFCQWVPRYIFRGEEFKMIIKTFHEVFSDITVWQIKGSGDFMLIGVNGKIRPVDEILHDITEKMQSKGFKRNDVILVSDSQDVARRLQGYEGIINTDDHPIVEFIGARKMFELIAR